MNADHELLLFYCAVRWLSKGNVLCRVFELRKELKEFLQLQKKDIFVAALNDENWCKQLAYLAGIFGHLHKLNLKRQGTELNVITFKNTLHGFIAKLQNWRRNVDLGNTAILKTFLTCMEVELILLNSLNQQYHSTYMGLKKN